VKSADPDRPERIAALWNDTCFDFPLRAKKQERSTWLLPPDLVCYCESGEEVTACSAAGE
jgi:hypothetical protein